MNWDSDYVYVEVFKNNIKRLYNRSDKILYMEVKISLKINVFVMKFVFEC